MFKLYFAAPIDMCLEKALKQIESFKKLFAKYQYTKGAAWQMLHHGLKPEYEGVEHPISVYGAGFGDSPIITPESSKEYKGVVSAYDLRKIRECDILLVVTDLKQFAAGTFQELEYARNLGIYTILMVIQEKISCVECVLSEKEAPCNRNEYCDNMMPKLKNIFLETYANKIIYSMNELEDILKDLTQ